MERRKWGSGEIYDFRRKRKRNELVKPTEKSFLFCPESESEASALAAFFTNDCTNCQQSDPSVFNF